MRQLNSFFNSPERSKNFSIFSLSFIMLRSPGYCANK